nr:LLM class flavin-dependent oxidoreductase [Mitsuaria sp. TWR114]
MLFQAGTSSRGRAFAGRHAECIFVSGPSKAVVKGYVDGLREAVVAAGRAPGDVLIYGQALIITAPTAEAAQAKLEDLERHVDLEAALALLSGWTGVDFSRYPLDATIDYLDAQAGRTALASFSSADPTRRWTVGEAAAFIGLGGRGPVFVGDPAQVADQLLDWQAATGLDGFNLAYALAHETFRDVVELVVPELRRRGRYPPEHGPGATRRRRRCEPGSSIAETGCRRITRGGRSGSVRRRTGVRLRATTPRATTPPAMPPPPPAMRPSICPSLP